VSTYKSVGFQFEGGKVICQNIGNGFDEFQRNEKAFGAMARSAGNARGGSFARAFIDDFDFGVGIKRALAKSPLRHEY